MIKIEIINQIIKITLITIEIGISLKETLIIEIKMIILIIKKKMIMMDGMKEIMKEKEVERKKIIIIMLM